MFPTPCFEGSNSSRQLIGVRFPDAGFLCLYKVGFVLVVEIFCWLIIVRKGLCAKLPPGSLCHQRMPAGPLATIVAAEVELSWPFTAVRIASYMAALWEALAEPRFATKSAAMAPIAGSLNDACKP